MIIVPNTRWIRCSAMLENRASGNALCNRRFASTRSPMRELDLGQSLQAVRLAGRRADVPVQLHRLAELALRRR